MATVAIVPLIELALPSVISSYSRYFLGSVAPSLAIAAPASIAWSVNNRANLYEFAIPAVFTIRFLRWQVGAVSSGNYDMGIYDRNFALLRSLGSTPFPAINTSQILAITPLTLQPGAYYVAFVVDNTTAEVVGLPPLTTQNMQIAGIRGATGSLPLPTTISPGTTPNAVMQNLAIANQEI